MPNVNSGSTIGRGARHEEVVELGPRLPPDAQDVFEPRGRDERNARALALEHGVGRDRRSVNDFWRRDAAGERGDAGQNRPRRII